jgi:dipeptidyl aminopeptidase/acylaminoacyl peptidase
MKLPLVAVLCGWIGSVAAVAAETPVLPVETYARADIASGLALSRDGRTIAYASGQDRDWLLILRDWDTGKTREFGNGASSATPVWTSAERLVFGAGASMDRDGTNFEAGKISGPSRVLAARIEGEFAGDVLVRRYTLPVGGHRQLVYVPAYPHVDRVNLRTGRVVPVVENPGTVTDWFADGAGLVRVGNETKGALNRVIARASEAEGWRVLPGLDFARNQFTPLWVTADGAKLGLAHRTPEGTWGIYHYDLNAGRLGELLLSHDNYDLLHSTTPILAPKTRELLGVYFHTDKPRAFWLDPHWVAVQQALDQSLPGRINQITSLSDDLQRMLVLSRTANDPGVYYQFDLAAKELKPVFPRRPWIKSAQMADVFPASYKARDGQVIRGYLTIPAGRAPKNLPLVVWAHDGPGGRATWSYDGEIQFLASRGYAVLTVNYRGSTGYGQAFEDQGTRHPDGVVQDDITDGTRWAITQGIADPARIAIIGRGFGGTCALLGQTREPGLYRCGISIDGMTDLAAFLAYRRQIDPSGIAFLEDRLGDPERDAAVLRAASPLGAVDRLATPVLLVIGNGSQVSIEETNAYRAALKRAHKTHDVLSKWDDVDGFSYTKGRTELYTRIEQFLAAHLAVKRAP